MSYRWLSTLRSLFMGKVGINAQVVKWSREENPRLKPDYTYRQSSIIPAIDLLLSLGAIIHLASTLVIAAMSLEQL